MKRWSCRRLRGLPLMTSDEEMELPPLEGIATDHL